MDNGKDSKKMVSTKAKIICYIAVCASFPLFLFVQYMQNGRLRILDFLCAGLAIIVGVVIISLMAWHANKPEKED